MRVCSFHVNVVSNRRQIEAVFARMTLPGLAALGLLIILGELKWLSNWAFILLFAVALISLVMAFFPYYSNAMVHVSEEGITVEKHHVVVRSIKWSDIEYITFGPLGKAAVYGRHIGAMIGLDGEEVRFGIYQYLSKSPRTITRELIRVLLKIPEARKKLPEDVVEGYSAMFKET